MDTQPLNLKVDSGQARADLAALAKALDHAGAAAGRMAASFTSGMGGADRAIKGSMANMEKFAQVASHLSKIKINADGAKAVSEFSKALGTAARVKEIERQKLDSWRRFIEMGALTSRLRMDPAAANSLAMFARAMDAAAKARAIDPSKIAAWGKMFEVAARASQLRLGAAGFVGLNMFTQAMDQAARGRAMSQAKLKGWVDFIEVAARASQLRITGRTAGALKQFADSMSAIGQVRAISSNRVAALKNFFDVLGQAKPMPYAQAVTKDLDHIARAAARAGAALATLPPRMRGLGPATTAAAAGGDRLHRTLMQAPGRAGAASRAYHGLGLSLGNLGHRFSVAYHAGTIFSAMFSAFTVGQYIKNIFDTSIAVNKLQTALFFATGSMAEASMETDNFYRMANRMGVSIRDSADAYSRFTISARTSGLTLEQSNAAFEAVSKTLTVVGASSAQMELAFYGLTQMIMKGKVSSEEFNRQIGEQIPGNAQIGARAMSELEGRFVSVAEFFDKMRKGEIMSKDFLLAYARALEEEFGPMMEMALRRPDVALRRLQNAFTVFQAEVGKSGFMLAVGTAMEEITGKIIDADGALTPFAKNLAQTLGRNLGNMVKSAGSALQWLMENLDKVVLAGKALITVFLVDRAVAWGRTIADNAGFVLNLASNASRATAALLGLNAAQAAVSKGTVATATGATAASVAGAMGGPGTTVFGRRQVAPDMPSNTRRTINMREAGFATQTRPGGLLGTAANAVGLGSLFMGRGTAGAGGAAASAGRVGMLARMAPLISGIGTAIAGLAPIVGTVLAVIAPWAAAMAGVAGVMLLLSDRTTKLGDTTVKFKDILGSAWDIVAGKVSDALSTMGIDFSKFQSSFDSFVSGLGDVMVDLTAALMWTAEMVVDSVMAIVNAVDAGQKAMRGDFVGAGRKLLNIQEDWSDNGIDGYRERLVRGAEERAAARAAQELSDGRDAATFQAAEQARQEAMARQAAQERQIADEAMARRVELGRETELTWDDILRTANDTQRRAAEAQRDLVRGGQEAADALRGAARDVSMQAVGWNRETNTAAIGAPATRGNGMSFNAGRYSQPLIDMARRFGVDPNVMGRLIQKESSWNASAVGPGGDAVGLGQFTADTWNSVMRGRAPQARRGMGASDPRLNPMLNLEATARYMQSNNQIGQRILGRDLSAGEQYLYHFLGTSGASRLLGTLAENPNMRIGDTRGIVGQRGIRLNPVFQGGDATVGDVYRWALGLFGEDPARVRGGAGAPAGGTQGLTAEELADAQNQQREREQRARRMIRATQGPQGAAEAQYYLTMSEVGELVQQNAAAVAQGQQSVLRPGDVEAIAANAQRKFERDSNPFIETAEQRQYDYQVAVARGAGRDVEAGFMEEVNGYLQRGFQFTEDQLRVAQESYTLDMRRLRLLEQQNALVEAQNQAALQAAGDTLDPVTSAALARINEIYEGGTLAEKAARAAADGVLDLQARIARVQIEAQASVAARGMSRGMTNARADMSGSFAARSNALLRERLGELTGMDGRTLDELVSAASNLNVEVDGATQNMLAFAQAAVQAEQALDRQGRILQATRGLSDMARTAGMSDFARARDEGLRSTLEGLTGLEGLTMGELVEEASNMRGEIAGASVSMLEFAQRVEQAKQELENQPGFQRWVNALEPFAQRMEDIKSSFLDGLSDGLTDSLMGEDVDWGNIAKQLQRQVIKAQVDEGLAGIMGMFGVRRGAVRLSPEAQATIDAANAHVAAARTTDTAAGDLTGAGRSLTSAADQLIAAADALSRAASPQAFTPEGVAIERGGMADEFDMAFAAAQNGDPSEAIRLGLRDASTTAANGVLDRVQSVVDDIFNAAGLAGPNISGRTTSPEEEAMFGLGGPVMADEFDMAFAAAQAGDPSEAIRLGLRNAPTTATVSMEPLATAAEQAVTAGVQAGVQAAAATIPTSASLTTPSAAMSEDEITQTLTAINQAPPTTEFDFGSMVARLMPHSGLSGADMNAILSGDQDPIPQSPGFMSSLFNRGPLGFIGQLFGRNSSLEERGSGLMGAFGLAGMLSNLFGGKDDTPSEPRDLVVNGLLNQPGAVEVTGTEVGPKANVLGSILSSVVGMAAGNGFGAPGGNLTSFMKARGSMGSGGGPLSWLGRAFGMFEEGGVATQPVRYTTGSFDWSKAPQYAEGTPNTSGGMPAILHPNEAVIPLSRGRAVPVEMNGMTGNQQVVSNITIVANDPNAFRASRAKIARDQTRTLKRASTRNLNPL